MGTHCQYVTIMTKEGSLITGSIYAALKAIFDEILEEWEHIISQNFFFICRGHFNAYSTLWGYPNETIAGKSLENI